jgi:L-amino acid N-acyltransferase YncA
MAPIRFAQPPDLPRIVAICDAAIPGRTATAVTVATRNAWFRIFDPTQPLRVVAEASDDPFPGWLSLHSFYGRQAYLARVEVGTTCTDLAIPAARLA